jgi:hypothetical protein
MMCFCGLRCPSELLVGLARDLGWGVLDARVDEGGVACFGNW